MEQLELSLLLVGVKKQNSFEVKLSLPLNPTIPLLGIYPKEVKNTYSHKALQKNVHNSSIHISPTLETAQGPINRRRINYGISIHRILLSIKRNKILMILRNNMAHLRNITLDDPDPECYTQYDSISMKFKNGQTICECGNQKSGCYSGSGRLNGNVCKGTFWGDRNVLF